MLIDGHLSTINGKKFLTIIIEKRLIRIYAKVIMITTILSIFVVVSTMNSSLHLIYAKSDPHKDSSKIAGNEEASSNASINTTNINKSKEVDSNNNDNFNINNNNATTGQTEAEPMIPVQQNIRTAPITSDPNLVSIPEGKNCATNLTERPNPIEYLTYFNCGHIHILSNGTAGWKGLL